MNRLALPLFVLLALFAGPAAAQSFDNAAFDETNAFDNGSFQFDESGAPAATGTVQNANAPIAVVFVTPTPGVTVVQNAQAPLAVVRVTPVAGVTVVQNPQAPLAVVEVTPGSSTVIQNPTAPIAVVEVTPNASTVIQNPQAPQAVVSQ